MLTVFGNLGSVSIASRAGFAHLLHDWTYGHEIGRDSAYRAQLREGVEFRGGSVHDLNDDQQSLAFRFSHVGLPEYATDCEPWEWFGDAWRRYFTVKDWNVAGLRVSVGGEQTHRGDVTRWMHVAGENQCSTVDRQLLIEALVDAGHLLDSLD